MSATRGTTFHFYVKPSVVTYRRSQADEFARYLSDSERFTSILPIERERELHLREDGTTYHGHYRYAPAAFHQVVQILGPGLSRLLPDLAGIVHRSKDDRLDLIDGHRACALFNDLVSLRFPLLSSRRLIRNEHSKTIEGVVGVKHKYLENSMLYTAANERLESRNDPARFYTAVLVSRRMALWYRHETPCFTIQVGRESWPCYAGYYFGNGEATGTSARGTLAFYTKCGVCLGPFKRHGGRVTHAGRDFSKRLNAMLSKVLDQPVLIEEWRDGILRMQATNLGFGDKIGKDRRTHERVYLAALSQLGVEQSLSAEALDSALTLGAIAPERPIADLQPLVATRTVFDLFVALLRVGRRLGLARREKIEQAAYEILVGRLHV